MWGPTALPIREKTASYAVRHGQGYSRFDHASHGISLELLQYVPVDDSIKISRLKIANHSGARAASVDHGLCRMGARPEPLGDRAVRRDRDRSRNRRDLRAESVERSVWRARGVCGPERPANGMDLRPDGIPGPRRRDGSAACADAGALLSNRVGAGLDPCGALQTQVRLGAAGTTEIVFFLGQSATKAEAQSLLAKYREADLDAVFAEVTRQWDDTLGVVQVKTPDRALDILLNRWLPYQTLACRVWARTAFYQASGAYGFRDQLQDVMALCVSRPEIARAHHPHAPRRGNSSKATSSIGGCRNPGAVSAHASPTTAAGSPMSSRTMSRSPATSPCWTRRFRSSRGPCCKKASATRSSSRRFPTRQASLFEHCALALDKSLATGAHGLPLMGTGDWNDGMDRVGEGGKGESVWLGWFLYSALTAFADLAEQHGNPQRAAAWRQHAAALKEALEREAWDGDWYRRAYFDDGSPLGSVANNECRIDSIAQSWAVISGAAEPTRAARAMAAVDKYLVRRDDKLLLLFTPPFDNPARDPGYIKGYPPGIRENGGQYTHGAVWAALAFAMQGDGDRAGELLSMLNPIHHADSPTGIHRYKVEPYVVCADLYSEPPHVGRGGWTWYTGSAGWMYRVALEWLLGFRVAGRQSGARSLHPA